MATRYPNVIDNVFLDDMNSPIPAPISSDPRDEPSLSGWVSNLYDAMVAVQTELGVAPSGLSITVADRLNAYGTAITDAEADIIALQTDLGTAQTNIQTNVNDITTLNGQVATLQANSSGNTTDISDLQAKVGTGATLPSSNGAVLQSNGVDTVWSTQLRSAQGSAALPTYSFLDDPDTGVTLVGIGQLGLVIGGEVRASLTNTGQWMLGPYANAATPALSAAVLGDTEYRFLMDAGGSFRWSDGVSAPDVTLARTGPGLMDLASRLRSQGFGVGVAPDPEIGYRFVATDPAQTGLFAQGAVGHTGNLINVVDDAAATLFSVSPNGMTTGVPSALGRVSVGQRFSRARVVITDATAAYNADLSVANTHDITLTQNSALTISNPAAGQETTLYLTVRQNATGGWTFAWPASVLWVGGTAPTVTATANAVDRFVLTTYDDGATYFGRVLGQNFQ